MAYEDDNLRDWQERHPDSKREAARRRFKERPYQLVVLEEMRKEQEAHGKCRNTRYN